ncbi:MAG: 50S ribosomal protein L13 [Planctomycetes bacterium]|nr:50S ribosomal protein L13 [Planctomycetota bacterium]
MKTFMLRKEDVQRRWFEIDAAGKILGKVAAKAARVLMGKESPTYSPGVDCGQFVIVTNAREVKVSGRKETGKLYFRHTEYVGSGYFEPVAAVRARKPEEVIRLAVKRMLPKNTLGEHMGRRLKVYAGKDHPHAAQKPERIEVAGPRAAKA